MIKFSITALCTCTCTMYQALFLPLPLPCARESLGTRLYSSSQERGFYANAHSYSDSWLITVKGIVENPRNSSVSLGEQISMNCRVTCAESSVVTWLINGRPLNTLQMKQNFRISNNYITECAHSQNHPQGSNYTEVLDVIVTDRGMVSTMLAIQCVSVYICRDGIRNCIPSTCLSQRAYLTGANNARLT